MGGGEVQSLTLLMLVTSSLISYISPSKSLKVLWFAVQNPCKMATRSILSAEKGFISSKHVILEGKEERREVGNERRKKGRKKGRKEGRKEGRNEGRKEGRMEQERYQRRGKCT